MNDCVLLDVSEFNACHALEDVLMFFCLFVIYYL